MAVEETPGGGFAVTGRQDVNMFAMLSQRGMLHMQIRGMTRRGLVTGVKRTIASHGKPVSHIRNARQALADLNALIAELGGPPDPKGFVQVARDAGPFLVDLGVMTLAEANEAFADDEDPDSIQAFYTAEKPRPAIQSDDPRDRIGFTTSRW